MGQSRKKIALVGSGNIGSTLALLIAQKRLGDIVCIDVVPGLGPGKALDLSQFNTVEKLECCIEGSEDFSAMKNADVVIITAGVPRKPGMTRDDLIGVNVKIIKNVASHIKNECPDAFVICITNPLDVIVSVLQKEANLAPEKCVGMAGMLDSHRMKYFLAERIGISADAIQTLVLGGHGDTMVPLPRYTSVAGIPLAECVNMGMVSNDEIKAIVERTRNGGGEIVNLLKTGSAFYAPAASAVAMAESYLLDMKKVMSCCAMLNGEYNLKDIYVGVPVVIGRGGVEKVIELQLDTQEKQLFGSSVNAVRELLENASRVIEQATNAKL